METTVKGYKSSLFVTSALAGKEELEDRLEKCYNTVNNLINGLSEREAHDALNNAACKGMQQHEEISLGLLYKILVEPSLASKSYRDLAFMTRDSFGLVTTKVIQIITDKFSKLQETVRTQIHWLTNELVKNSVLGSENICYSLLRQVQGGDTSPGNIWLAESVLNLLTSNRPWLEKHSWLLATGVYTYLRLLEDHEAPALQNLKQMEVEFCVTMLKERFVDCMQIGRDLVRLLQSVARISEIHALWKDLLQKPQSFSPQFSGILQILYMRTSRKFLACRLTPDMENKILFLTSKVKFGQQKRYQDWFHKQYLASPESQSLRPDIIRYLCGVVHPSNEVLCSDIVPRWAIIGWLLMSCQTPVCAANSKLALFYDWLFFFPGKDNIMNIEPAILVMHHSLKNHPGLTFSLLDFLCRSVSQFSVQLEPQVKQGVSNALKCILNKKVVMSLLPVIENPRLDKDLRIRFRATFPEFCSESGSSKLEESATSAFTKVEGSGNSVGGEFSVGNDSVFNSGSGITDTKDDLNIDSGLDDELDVPGSEAVFSDPEDEEEGMEADTNGTTNPRTEPKAKEYSFRPIIKDEEQDDDGLEDITDMEELDLIGPQLKDLIIKLFQEKDVAGKSEEMESIVSSITSMDQFEDELAGPVALCLNHCLAEDIALPCLPKDINDKSLEEVLEGPLYVLFKSMCALPAHDIGRERLLLLIGEMHNIESKIGYHFIFYLRASSPNGDKLSLYEDFANGSRSEKTIQTCLIEDLKTCQDYDRRLFVYLLPAIYKKFSKFTVNNSEMLHLVVSTVTPAQLHDFICKVMLGDMEIFGNKHLDTLLESTLDWDTFEQYCVWRLLEAEDPPLESIIGILPSLKSDTHSEALASMLLILRNMGPSGELLQPLLCMDCSEATSISQFTTCILRHWCSEYQKELAQIISTLINKQVSANKKRTARNSVKHQPSLEQILSHLDAFFRACKEQQDISFFKQENIRISLEQVRQSGPESRKAKFKQLMSVLDEKEPRKRNTRYRANVRRNSESSSSDSEEEEQVKPRQTKRRRKASQSVDSDSDD